MADGPHDGARRSILTVNGGSSSIKFALYEADERPRPLLHGKVDRIGMPGTRVTLRDLVRNEQHDETIEAPDHRSAATVLIDTLRSSMESVTAVGHRVVHGMKYTEPTLITAELLNELRRIAPYDPDHLPCEIELIELIQGRYPQLHQVACFDTAFHRTMPRVARLLAIPRRFDAMGIQRYGFHGLSYAYLMEELARVAGTQPASGRTILAHLGNGASMAAVLHGKSVDTSMGFTPAGGLPMGTRPGDLDPGVAAYLMRSGIATAREFNDLVNHEAGLLGVSETSADMRDLLEREATDARAGEAVELFCYQARKWIGAFAAVLEGLDTLVFAGGIGENAPQVRARICAPLAFLGIELEAQRNAANAPLISADRSRVVVRVIPTDEEVMIARSVRRILNR